MSPTSIQSVFSTKSQPPPLKDFGGKVTVFKENNPGQYIEVSQSGTENS